MSANKVRTSGTVSLSSEATIDVVNISDDENQLHISETISPPINPRGSKTLMPRRALGPLKLKVCQPWFYSRRRFINKISDFLTFLEIDSVEFPANTPQAEKYKFFANVGACKNSLNQLRTQSYKLNDYASGIDSREKRCEYSRLYSERKKQAKNTKYQISNAKEVLSTLQESNAKLVPLILRKRQEQISRRKTTIRKDYCNQNNVITPDNAVKNDVILHPEGPLNLSNTNSGFHTTQLVKLCGTIIPQNYKELNSSLLKVAVGYEPVQTHLNPVSGLLEPIPRDELTTSHISSGEIIPPPIIDNSIITTTPSYPGPSSNEELILPLTRQESESSDYDFIRVLTPQSYHRITGQAHPGPDYVRIGPRKSYFVENGQKYAITRPWVPRERLAP